jgi:hypothetical protein
MPWENAPLTGRGYSFGGTGKDYNSSAEGDITNSVIIFAMEIVL